MAILPISDQYKYSARGPFDAKALVKTYADLLKPDTWEVSGKAAAYNGMITSVWLNKEDTSKNGVYFLYDPTITSTIKAPDVTNEANWHKLIELSDISDFSNRLSVMESELTGVNARLAALEDGPVVLRRDNDYNYKKIETTFVPAFGEVCLVDIAGYGIRLKVGDGNSAFAALPYIDEPLLKNIDNLIIKGYFYQDRFYSDSSHTELLESITGRIYIDAISSKLYTYNGISYEPQRASLPNATADVAGTMKLYDQLGQNVDGTMTQRAITSELNEKFELDVIEEEEMVVFDTDID